jgi:glycosyltransferase involved in cell wall biosynthesis
MISAKYPISVVIIANNEEKNLIRCVNSVSWSNDIILVDSGSTDSTLSVADKLGIRIYHNNFIDYADQRNYVTRNNLINNKFTLYLDADEEVTEELKAELIKILTSDKLYAGYKIPFKLIWMNRWLRYSGMYPAYQVRFGQTDKLIFKMVGHGQREDLDINQVGVINSPINHYNFSKGTLNWIVRHCNYAKLESFDKDDGDYTLSGIINNSTVRRRWLKKISYHLPCRPIFRFIYIYIIKYGFLDGKYGFRYAILLSVYEYMIDLNNEEKHNDNNSNFN